MAKIIFLILSFLAVFGAVMTIFSRNYMHSILFLILCFFAVAAHYALLHAGFLAIVNIIVYAGAIMVLFLFVVMLLNLNKHEKHKFHVTALFTSVISGGMLLFTLLAAISKYEAVTYVNTMDAGFGGVKYLGALLFNEYVLPFELTSLLFLSAMIGAMILIKKENK